MGFFKEKQRKDTLKGFKLYFEEIKAKKNKAGYLIHLKKDLLVNHLFDRCYHYLGLVLQQCRMDNLASLIHRIIRR